MMSEDAPSAPQSAASPIEAGPRTDVGVRLAHLQDSQPESKVDSSPQSGRELEEVAGIREIVEFGHQACHVLAEVRDVVLPASVREIRLTNELDE